MNSSRGKREHAEAERPDSVGGGTPGRRSVLGGLAALPVLYGVGSAAPALTASAVRPGTILEDITWRFTFPVDSAGTQHVQVAELTGKEATDRNAIGRIITPRNP